MLNIRPNHQPGSVTALIQSLLILRKKGKKTSKAEKESKLKKEVGRPNQEESRKIKPGRKQEDQTAKRVGRSNQEDSRKIKNQIRLSGSLKFTDSTAGERGIWAELEIAKKVF
ncbi:MAG: hypothetical protein ACHQXK_02895 [Methanosarcina thermophila]